MTLTELEINKKYFILFYFSYIAAGFGSSYGVAIGFSLTAAVELVYWMLVKPFGLTKEAECEHCTRIGVYKHHYPTVITKHITRIGQGLTTTVLVAYFWYRFYLVAVLYYYPPIPEEKRNKIIQNLY